MQETNTHDHIVDTQNKKKSRKPIIITAIVIVSLVLLGGAFMAYTAYKNDLRNDEYSREWESHYNNVFASMSEYNNLSDDYKSCIVKVFVDNNYIDGSAFLTKVPSRAKKIITFGNFSGDDNLTTKDIAFIVEKNDFKSSIIFIMSYDRLLIFSKNR